MFVHECNCVCGCTRVRYTRFSHLYFISTRKSRQDPREGEYTRGGKRFLVFAGWTFVAAKERPGLSTGWLINNQLVNTDRLSALSRDAPTSDFFSFLLHSSTVFCCVLLYYNCCCSQRCPVRNVSLFFHCVLHRREHLDLCARGRCDRSMIVSYESQQRLFHCYHDHARYIPQEL